MRHFEENKYNYFHNKFFYFRFKKKIIKINYQFFFHVILSTEMEQQLFEDSNDNSASYRAENKETSSICKSSANEIDNGYTIIFS